MWDQAFGDLIFLKKLRNRIAHGEIEPVPADKCAQCENAVLDALANLRGYLERSVTEEAFRRRDVA